MSNRVAGGRVGTVEAEAQGPPDQPRSPFPAPCVPSHARLGRGFGLTDPRGQILLKTWEGLLTGVFYFENKNVQCCWVFEIVKP